MNYSRKQNKHTKKLMHLCSNFNISTVVSKYATYLKQFDNVTSPLEKVNLHILLLTQSRQENLTDSVLLQNPYSTKEQNRNFQKPG